MAVAVTDVTTPEGGVGPAKFLSLEGELNTLVFERTAVIRGLVTALLSSEANAPIPMILIGDSGGGKSMLIRAVARAVDAAMYENSLTPGTTTDDVFGPIWAKKMLDEAIVERNPAGKLPARNVILLDEFFYGNDEVHARLLPVLESGRWANGDGLKPMQMDFFVAASNVVPNVNDRRLLKAQWERFVLRYKVSYIQEEENFLAMLRGAAQRRATGAGTEAVVQTRITLAELKAARESVRAVDVSRIMQPLFKLQQEMLQHQFTVGDRRWTQYLAVIQAQAFLAGRQVATVEDMMILQHCLWERPEQAEQVERLVHGFLVRAGEFDDRAEELVDDGKDLLHHFKMAAPDMRRAMAAETGEKFRQLAEELEGLIQQARETSGEVPAVLKEAKHQVALMNNEVGDLLSKRG